MGQLVFQATLGGQVNLVGPNTASTFNLNVPAVSSTLATLTGTETFTNKTLTSPTLTAPVLGTPASGTLTNCTGLPNAGLVNSSVTVGSTAIALGATTTTVAGLTSLATNTLTSAASTALTLQSAGTTAVTIDTSQRVGIGTASPTQALTVAGQMLSIASSGASFKNITPTTSNNYMWLGNTGNNLYVGKESSSGGSLFVGSSAYAGVIGNDGAYPLQFATNNNVQATIDSSGNLLVGTTAAVGQEKFLVTQAAGNNAAFIRNTRGNTGDVTLALWSASTRDTSSYLILGLNNNQPGSGQIFNVYANGNVQNANNSYGAISDAKLKENIIDATPKLDDLMKVKVRNYNMIGDTTKQIGVVAQELEQIFPSMVEETPDRDIDGNDLGTTTKAVKYSVFVPMLIKSIQEQQALIDTQAETINALTARIVALEAK